MALRTLSSVLLAALLGLAGCTDSSQGFPDRSGTNDPVGPIDGGGFQGDDLHNGGSNSSQSLNPDPSSGEDPAAPDAPGGAEPVPEPGPILLLGVGLTCLAFYRRRRQQETEGLHLS